jgi:hypothetical protein
MRSGETRLVVLQERKFGWGLAMRTGNKPHERALLLAFATS